MSEPRERVAELEALLRAELGPDLLGLYLFGSLAAGGFVEGRSDVDLFAVVEDAVDEARLARLRRLHADYVAAHPDWWERVEVGYVDRSVLQTFAGEPAGTIAVISPGEPLHITEPRGGWVLNWYDVCTQGEVVHGPPPLELGPALSNADYRRVVMAQLAAWQDEIREPRLAYVPAAQGYAVVTICRALYALETGGQTTKEAAAAWGAGRFPQWADFDRGGARRVPRRPDGTARGDDPLRRLRGRDRRAARPCRGARPCTRASPPGSGRAPRASRRRRASGGSAPSSCAAGTPKRFASTAERPDLHVAEARELPDPALQVGRVLGLRPDPLRVAAVLVGDEAGQVVHARRHRAGEAVDRRLLAEHLLELARIGLRDLLRVDRPQPLLQPQRALEGLLDGHLLVEREPDQERERRRGRSARRRRRSR